MATLENGAIIQNEKCTGKKRVGDFSAPNFASLFCSSGGQNMKVRNSNWFDSAFSSFWWSLFSAPQKHSTDRPKFLLLWLNLVSFQPAVKMDLNSKPNVAGSLNYVRTYVWAATASSEVKIFFRLVRTSIPPPRSANANLWEILGIIKWWLFMTSHSERGTFWRSHPKHFLFVVAYFVFSFFFVINQINKVQVQIQVQVQLCMSACLVVDKTLKGKLTDHSMGFWQSYLQYQQPHMILSQVQNNERIALWYFHFY